MPLGVSSSSAAHSLGSADSLTALGNAASQGVDGAPDLNSLSTAEIENLLKDSAAAKDFVAKAVARSPVRVHWYLRILLCRSSVPIYWTVLQKSSLVAVSTYTCSKCSVEDICGIVQAWPKLGSS